jgi:serine/threonine protein kinase
MSTIAVIADSLSVAITAMLDTGVRVRDKDGASSFILGPVLGKGTYGTVYKSGDNAIKIFKRGRDYRGAFQSELDIMRRMTAADEHGGKQYTPGLSASFNALSGNGVIVMPLYGKNLAQELQDRLYVPSTPIDLHHIATCVTSALAFLARIRVVHTDVKLDNMVRKLPSRAGRGGEVVLLDYSSGGVGQVLGADVTSMWYRAPETYMDATTTHMSDMWSFGCSLIELATGYPLFPVYTTRNLVRRHVGALGTPPERLLRASAFTSIYFMPCANNGWSIDGDIMNEYPPVLPRTIQSMERLPEYQHIVRRVILWTCGDRMSAAEALAYLNTTIIPI